MWGILARGFFVAKYHVPALFATGVEPLNRSVRCHAGRQPPWQRKAYEAFKAADLASTVVATVA